MQLPVTQQMIDAMPVLVAFVDKQQTYRLANKIYCNTLGLSTQQLIGRKVADVMGEERYQKIAQSLQRSLSGETISYEVQLSLQNKQKTWFARYAPVFENEQVIGVSALIEDVTEVRRLEQEKNQALSELQKTIEEMKTLKGIIPICSYCHNIRCESGTWQQLEAFITQHSDAHFSHGICPDCVETVKKQIMTEPK